MKVWKFRVEEGNLNENEGMDGQQNYRNKCSFHDKRINDSFTPHLTSAQ